MMRLLLIAGLMFVLLPSAAQTSMTGNGTEEVLQRAVVPSVEDPHGEVQIIRRGNELVVRSLLFSPILKRVAGTIDEREDKRWDMDSAGFVESQRYRERLYQATLEAWRRFRERDDREQRRQALGIEFIRGVEKDRISLLFPQLSGEFGRLKIESADTFDSWGVRGEYVKENMIEIVHNSFAMDRAQASSLLTNLWQDMSR